MSGEQWTGKLCEERGHEWTRYFRSICLKGLRETARTSGQLIHRHIFELEIFKIQVRISTIPPMFIHFPFPYCDCRRFWILWRYAHIFIVTVKCIIQPILTFWFGWTLWWRIIKICKVTTLLITNERFAFQLLIQTVNFLLHCKCVQNCYKWKKRRLHHGNEHCTHQVTYNSHSPYTKLQIPSQSVRRVHEAELCNDKLILIANHKMLKWHFKEYHY